MDIQNDKDLSSWINLFERRAIWAENACIEARNIKNNIDAAVGAVKIMERAVQVAFTNLGNSSGSSRKTLTKFNEWAEKTVQEQNQKLTGWETSYRLMGGLAIHQSVAAAVKRNGVPPRKLQDLFSYQELREAARASEKYIQQSKAKINDLGGMLEALAVQTENLGKDIQRSRYIIIWEYEGSTSSVSNSNTSQTPAEDEPGLLLGDTETITKSVRQGKSTRFSYALVV